MSVGGISDKQSKPAFDMKASVKSVFEAAVSGKHSPDDGKVHNARARKAHIVQLTASLRSAGGDNTKLPLALGRLANTLLGEGSELDFLAVKRAARRVPRVSGQRMEWIRGVGLDAALARHLNPGTLEDGLEGVRAMSTEAALRALAAFFEDAKLKFLQALREVKEAKGSKSAVEANSKFADGFQGSFASLRDFHAGAEATLELGYPNPDIMRGILLEHTAHPSAGRLFVTPNYRIATCLLIEYAWAALEKDATE